MNVTASTGDLPVLPEGDHAVDPVSADRFHVFSTLPQDTEENRLKVLTLLDGECLAGGDMIGAVISYSDYIIYPVQLTDKATGEVVPALRTLILGDGQLPVAFVSRGVLQSIQRIATTLQRLPPYDPPLQVKISQVATRGGGRLFKLIVQSNKG